MPYAKEHAPPTAPVFGNETPALGGMEQSVPSFRDFMKTAPPQRKPLPPIPSLALSLSDNPSRSEDCLKKTSEPWPREDKMDGERALKPPKDFFLQPATYTASNPALSKPEAQRPPLLQPRRFELIIPDPSPQPSPESRTPAFEYENHIDFPPSPASSKPPQSPLPPIPAAIGPAKPKHLSTLPKTHTPSSPAPVTRVVIPATASCESSLIISPFDLNTPLSPWTGDSSLYQQPIASISPRRLVPRSAAPGLDDEWEDVVETRRIRQDRLSQDYHAALVEQYRELVSPSSEIFAADESPRALPDPKTSRGNDDDDLIPLPLAPRKGSSDRYDVVDRSSPFPEDHYDQPPSSLSPQRSDRRRSSIREKLPALASGTLNMILPSKHYRNTSSMSSRSGEIPISPPADHVSFGKRAVIARARSPLPPSPKVRPRSRAFLVAAARPQSGVYTVGRTKPGLKGGKSKKKGKRGKKGKSGPAENTPPLALTLTSSLSTNDSSSTRPSTERLHRLNASAPIPTPGAASAQVLRATSSSPSTSSYSSQKSQSRSSPSATPLPPSITNKPPTPSPLGRGLTHTELFASPSSASALRPTYPRKMSSGPPASAPLPRQQAHRRRKSSGSRTGLFHALGLGKGEGSSNNSHSSGGDSSRLPFVHEKKFHDASAPGPLPSPSLLSGAQRSRERAGSRRGSSGAVAMPQVRSLAAAAVAPAIRSAPLPSSSSTSLTSLDKAKGGADARDAGAGGEGRGVAGWRLSSASQQQQNHLSLYKKAVEAHRSHKRERQKQEMKKSIRVLGQADPQQVVQGYVRVAAGAVAGPGIKPVYSRTGSGNADKGGEGWL